MTLPGCVFCDNPAAHSYWVQTMECTQSDCNAWERVLFWVDDTYLQEWVLDMEGVRLECESDECVGGLFEAAGMIAESQDKYGRVIWRLSDESWMLSRL